MGRVTGEVGSPRYVCFYTRAVWVVITCTIINYPPVFTAPDDILTLAQLSDMAMLRRYDNDRCTGTVVTKA